ncbi:MAG: hypothetical protein JRF56_19590 [Deltaproteobacteria bacterium]|jgi:hypothetical protein|nr:hypothetical protein [Deltaproteobacteria bacterium]
MAWDLLRNVMNAEREKIWKVLTNLDKADVQATAFCHAVVTLLIEKDIGSREEIAEDQTFH